MTPRLRAPLLALALLGLCPPPGARAQQGPLGVVDTVILAGNAKTRDYVFLNELTLRQGDTVTAEAMAYDRDRIYSLGLFTRVDVAYDSLEGIRFLFVEVSERWYLIPFPILGFRDGDPKRFFGGAGFLHNNVGGRNQKLRASIVFGSDPSASLSFSDPLLFHDERIFFSGGFSFSRVRNKSAVEAARTGDFEERHVDVNVTLGKRLTFSQTAGINVGYRTVEVSAWWPGRTLAPAGRDRFLYATASYVLDSRDLFEYPSRGGYLALFATKYGLGDSRVDFTRAGADLRRYVPLPFDLTLAARAQGSLVAGGPVPSYAHVFFGYGERLRGWFRAVEEGENIASGTIELRRFLLPPRIFRVSALPLPDEFRVWRFGLGAALFANAGTTWYRGQPQGWRTLLAGYGGGLHLLLPYSFVVRLEYAWNQYGRGEFILDLRGAI